MKIFKLPDLGEGLPDAIIREWYIKEGDSVKTDQPLVAMETAKALVDVPSPQDGKIEKLFGAVGDTIETHAALIGFEGEGDHEENKDSGTVVGAIEQSESVLQESAAGVQAQRAQHSVKATPAVRMLAKQLGVDLTTLTPKGAQITADEVKAAAGTHSTAPTTATKIPAGFTQLSNVKRAMVLSMTQSHQQIVPVTLTEDADIHSWYKKEDLMVRLARAIEKAAAAEPTLNAHFDSASMSTKQFSEINLAMAVDMPHGLFVPVIKNAAKKSAAELRSEIEKLKQQAQNKTMAPDDMKGGTIMLSNFGAFAGKYANPILLPPMVCILGIGRTRDEVVACNGKMEIHPVMPLSITCDHRAVTGGEMARFLKIFKESLQT